MLLILLATMVAVLTAAVCGRLANSAAARPRDVAPLSWSSTSMAAVFAGVFAGAAGYLGSAFEEYGIFVLAIAVIGPLTAAAWEQRLREARVYQPDAPRTLRTEETWESPGGGDSVVAGLGDENTTARENS